MEFDNPLVNSNMLGNVNQALTSFSKQHQNEGSAIANAAAQIEESQQRQMPAEQPPIEMTEEMPAEQPISDFVASEEEINQMLKAKLEEEVVKNQQLKEQIFKTAGYEEPSEGMQSAQSIGNLVGAATGAGVYANAQHRKGLKEDISAALSGIQDPQLKEILGSKYNKEAFKEVLSPAKNIAHVAEKGKLMSLGLAALGGASAGGLLAGGMYGLNEMKKEKQ